MMRFKAGVCILFAIVIGLNIYGEDKSSLVSYYDSEFIKINYQTFGGLTLSAQGKFSSMSMGISSDFTNLLSAYPDSKEAMKNYKSKNLIGNVLVFGGLAATIGGLYYPILSNDTSINNGYSSNTVRTGLYIAFGGLVAELIGAFVLPSSFQDLFNSVNMYNRNKMNTYRN